MCSQGSKDGHALSHCPNFFFSVAGRGGERYIFTDLPREAQSRALDMLGLKDKDTKSHVPHGTNDLGWPQ